MLEQIETLEQQIHDDETWLTRNRPTRRGYQERRQELDVLQAYVGELSAQVVALDDVLLELRWERKCWDDPDLLLAS